MRSTADTAALEDEEKVLIEPFSPAFVYPIFGQEETIFGYRDLEIHVRPRLPRACEHPSADRTLHAVPLRIR